MGFGDILVGEKEYGGRAKESTELNLREHVLGLIPIHDFQLIERTQYLLRTLYHFTSKGIISSFVVNRVFRWLIERPFFRGYLSTENKSALAEPFVKQYPHFLLSVQPHYERSTWPEMGRV